MQWFDRWIEGRTRGAAQRSSRRSFLTRVGSLIAGGMAIPLLPVARARESGREPAPEDPGDPNTCEYWRYCAVGGFLCGCCGGSVNSCPPGTEMSPVTWLGTCKNPADDRHYIISYNDCCGKSSCGRCSCSRSEGDTPVYMPAKSNDINWCMGMNTNVVHCTTAIVMGVALESAH